MQSNVSAHGMAVAPHHLASQSAVAVLREGGSAIEAMVAAAATIAVVPLCATYLPGIHCANVEFGVVTGLALAILYLLLRPIARALTGLIGCLTFGLTNILVDAGLVLLCANVMKEGFRVDSFWWALALALAINAARAVLGGLFKKK